MFYILKHYLFMRGATRGLKVSAIVTIAGIAVSVAALIVSLSVAGGFENAYKKSILDFNAHIILLKDRGEMDDYKELVDEVLMFEGVVGSAPFVYRESMLASKGAVKGVVVKGVDFKRLPAVSNILIRQFDGARMSDRTVLLGKNLAEKLGVVVPATINLLIGTDKFQKIGVTGTFESGLYDYDSQFVLMPIGAVQELFGMEDVVTGIEIKLQNPDDAPALSKMFEEAYPYPYHATSWVELNRPIFEAVHLEKIMFAIIVGVLVVVALFNIIGTLTLRILYKAADISILSAVGMKALFIRGIFTFHGLVLGSVGIVVGAIAGLGFAYFVGHLKLIRIEPEIYFLPSLPVKIAVPEVLAIMTAGFLLSVFVSFISARGVKTIGNVQNYRPS